MRFLTDFIEIKGDVLRYVSTGLFSSVRAIEKLLTRWPAVKSHFQSAVEERSLVWKSIGAKSGEKEYSKREIYMLFLQSKVISEESKEPRIG